MSEDLPARAFPRERFLVLLQRLPAYARLGWRLGRDPRLSRRRRMAVVAAAVYLISPVDLIPGIIPVAGQADDLLIAVAALMNALSGLPDDARRAHLAAAGIDESALAEDIRTLVDTGAWAVTAGARVVAAGAVAGGRVAAGGARRVAGLAVDAAGTGSQMASGAVRRGRWLALGAASRGRVLAAGAGRRIRRPVEPS